MLAVEFNIVKTIIVIDILGLTYTVSAWQYAFLGNTMYTLTCSIIAINTFILVKLSRINDNQTIKKINSLYFT